jgi:hypothetical protein
MNTLQKTDVAWRIRAKGFEITGFALRWIAAQHGWSTRAF